MPAIIPAAAAVGGALISANASKSAAKTQANAANAASAQEMAMFNQNRADQEPWRQAGAGALNSLLTGIGQLPVGYATDQNALRDRLLYQNPALANDPAALAGKVNSEWTREQNEIAAIRSNPDFGRFTRSFTAADMQADPVYQSSLQFGLDEGRKGLERSLAAKGGLLSGAAAKALTRFGSDYQGSKANESYNRFNNNQTQVYNRLAGVANTGQTSANQIASQGTQVANSIGNNIMGAGNARASGYIGGANALSGAIGQGVNMWQQNQMMGLLGGGSQSNVAGGGYNQMRDYNALSNSGW